jgi:aldehyde dehydrogenase (NAD+)
VNEEHTARIKHLIETAGGKLLIGGKVDIEKKTVEPTIILEPRKDSPILMEEIFAPVLPIISFSTIHQAITFVNGRPKPLCVYYFGQPNSANA